MTMKRGFTLIELLVVIAIIALLSTVVLASLNSARTKANDAKVRSDMAQVRTALQFYYDKHGYFPANPNPGTGVPIDQALQPLVTEGFIPGLPQSPYAGLPYLYYDYGPGNDPSHGATNDTPGALLVGTLQAAGTSVNGFPGSCRPWPAAANWCDASANSYYCLCNPY